MRCLHTRWWFIFFVIFTPTWGRFPFWLIFSKWVETTNQHIMFTVYCLLGMLVIQWCHWHHNSVTKDYTSCFQLWYISLQIWISPNLSVFAKARFSRVYLLMLVWFGNLVIYIIQHGKNGGKDWNRSIHCAWRIFSINVSADRLEVNFCLLTFTYSMGSMDSWTGWSAIIPNTCLAVWSGTSWNDGPFILFINVKFIRGTQLHSVQPGQHRPFWVLMQEKPYGAQAPRQINQSSWEFKWTTRNGLRTKASSPHLNTCGYTMTNSTSPTKTVIQ